MFMLFTRFLPIPAFLNGWISAVSVYHSDLESLKRYAEEWKNPSLMRLAEYPCLQREHGGVLVFFQTEELKERAKQELNACENGWREQDAAIKRIAGYPPKAVEFMYKHPTINPSAHLTEEEIREYQKRGDWGARIYYGGQLHEEIPDYYGGIHFVSALDEIEENVKWVWENLNIPSYVEKVTKIRIPIAYKHVKKEIKFPNKKEKETRVFWEPQHLEITVDYGDEKLLKKVKSIKEYTTELHYGKLKGKIELVTG